MDYSIGDNVTLNVEIIDGYEAEKIQSFGWFYNNTSICVCSCSSHYILSNGSKNLTIVNASVADVGVYEARVTSYQIYGYNDELCDKAMNELLEFQAVYAPVTYTLSYKSKPVIHLEWFCSTIWHFAVYEEKLSVTAATISQGHNTVASINESFIYNISYEKMETYIYFFAYIYQNGYLNQLLFLFNEIISGMDEFHISVNISTYQEDEAGEYFVIVYVLPLSLVDDTECGAYIAFLSFNFSVVLPVGLVEILQIHTAGNILLYRITVCAQCLVLSVWLICFNCQFLQKCWL